MGTMSTQTSVTAGSGLAPVPVAERRAWSTRGVKALVAGLVVLAGGIALEWYSRRQTGATATGLVWAGVVVLLLGALLLAGLTPVVPGQARVIQLFGKYRG